MLAAWMMHPSNFLKQAPWNYISVYRSQLRHFPAKENCEQLEKSESVYPVMISRFIVILPVVSRMASILRYPYELLYMSR